MNKKWKIEKMSVVFVFFDKKIFLSIKWKVVKKSDMSRIKRCCWKNDDVENEKNCVLLRKMYVWMKDNRDSVTRQENYQKRKIGFEKKNGFLSFIVLQALLCMH